MDVEMVFGPDPDLVTITPTGPASVEGFRRMIDEGVADARFRPPMRALLDYSHLDMGELSAADMREVAAHASQFLGALQGARVAVVAPRALTYGLTRVSTATLDLPDTEVQVFGERDAAEAWLATAG